MTRATYVFDTVTKTMVPKHLFQGSQELRNSTAVAGDLPDFVSPIDRKLYSGRAGLREHNKIHDVVPNAELKGLPTLTNQSDVRGSQERRADAADRKQHIINQVNRHYR